MGFCLQLMIFLIAVPKRQLLNAGQLFFFFWRTAVPLFTAPTSKQPRTYPSMNQTR